MSGSAPTAAPGVVGTTAGRATAHVGGTIYRCVLIAVLIAALAFANSASGAGAAGPASPTLVAAPCDVTVKPGDDLARAISTAPIAAHICFAAGTYRLRSPLRPRRDQVIDGRGHATLLGSRQIRQLVRRGDLYVAGHQTQQGQRNGTCLARTRDACTYPDAVYRDGRPMRRVMRTADLSANAFFFDYARDEILFTKPLSKLRILEVAVAPAAFVSMTSGSDTGVRITGFTIRMFATPAQHGAIATGAAGWTIDHNVVELNHGAGITTGDGATIHDNVVRLNGQLGIGGAGDDITVRSNRISGNGWAGFDPGWEAGGAKWAVSNRLRVSDNTVTSNIGPGLWDDIDSADVTYSGNLVTGNTRAGIFHEIGTTARITGNVVRDNGHGFDEWLWGAGILVAASSDTIVSGNTLSGNAAGIALIQQDRDDSDVTGLSRRLHGVSVTDNDIDLGHGGMGMVQDIDDPSVFDDPTITFAHNAYDYLDSHPFAWDDTDYDAAGWQAASHDTGSTYTQH